MNVKSQTSKAYFQFLRWVYAAIIIGLVLFVAVAYFAGLTPIYTGEELAAKSQNLNIIVPAIVVLGYLASSAIFKRQLASVKPEQSLSRKMNSYRVATIVRFALIEGPAMVAIIAYLMVGKWQYLAMAGLLVVLLVSLYPTPTKAGNELRLNYSEKQKVMDTEAVITDTIAGDT